MPHRLDGAAIAQRGSRGCLHCRCSPPFLGQCTRPAAGPALCGRKDRGGSHPPCVLGASPGRAGHWASAAPGHGARAGGSLLGCWERAGRGGGVHADARHAQPGDASSTSRTARACRQSRLENRLWGLSASASADRASVESSGLHARAHTTLAGETCAAVGLLVRAEGRPRGGIMIDPSGTLPA